MNAESFAAVSLVLLFILRSKSGSSLADREPPLSRFQSYAFGAAFLLVSLLVFSPTLQSPLLHDSYGHLTFASRASLSSVLSQFYTLQNHGDFFFRPIGYLSYWLDYHWAGNSAFRWNLWNLVVHACNSTLVYVLFRKLDLAPLPSFAAGLLFCMHASRPETVSWMAARFDLLSAFFVLLALISFVEYIVKGRRWYLSLVACTVLAGLSKEAAFCLPLLAWIVSIKLEAANRARRLIGLALVSATMAALFIYRLFMVGGIGGYKTSSGTSMILQVSVLRTAKALLYRQWALLFFPVNWSVSLEAWVVLILIGYLALLLYVVWTTSLPRAYVFIALGIVLSAALPVQHLLLLGPDLSGARVLYLPVLGLCFLFAILIQSAKSKSGKLIACVPMLVFQLAVLEHNLRIWNRVAILGQQTCQSIGNVLRKTNGSVEVAGIPAQLHGVFFVRNALPMCVFFNSGEDPSRVLPVADSTPETNGTIRLKWNNQAERLELNSLPK